MKFDLKNGIHFSAGATEVSYPSEGNDEYYNLEDNSFWFRYRNKVITYFIRRFLPQSGAFLDAGGGNGFVSREIESFGYKVTLLESGAGVFNAKKRGIKEIYQGNILDFDIGKSFQGVGLFDVIEHIDDRKALYASISRLLTGDGLLFVTVPAYEWLWSSEDDDARHLRRYTRRGVISELEDSGFESVHCTYFFSILIPLIFLFRSVPYRIGFRSRVEKAKKLSREHVSLGGRALFLILMFELRILRYISLPFGASILAIAKKKSI